MGGGGGVGVGGGGVGCVVGGGGGGGGVWVFFFLMIRRPPRSTLDRSSAASDVYKRQQHLSIEGRRLKFTMTYGYALKLILRHLLLLICTLGLGLSLIHISEPTRPY